MRASEDKDCFGNDLLSRLWVDVSFQKFLHEKKDVMICVAASFCAIHCIKICDFSKFQNFSRNFFLHVANEQYGIIYIYTALRLEIVVVTGLFRVFLIKVANN